MTAIDLSGRCAVVTGADSGIGAAIAKALADAGARVGLHTKTPRSRSIQAARAATVIADNEDPDQIRAAVRHLHTTLGRIHILVNNAGVFPRSPWSSIAVAQWDRVMDVNLRGSFLWSTQLARLMPPGGAIVNIASDAAFKGSPLGAHYSASKAGLIGLTKSLARSLAPRRVRVNAVAPGITRTRQPRLDANGFRREGRKIPLGRVAEPIDVAHAVLFLASDLASHITGQTVHVNGGSLMP